MDGTLLNSKDIITKKTQNAINAIVKKGIVFTISTGRPIQGVMSYNNILKLDAPFITYNGAMIIQSRTKEVLFKQDLNFMDAQKIFEFGQKLKTTVIVWSNNQLYVNKMNERTQRYQQLSMVKPIVIKDFDSLAHGGVTKIIWYDDIEKIQKFESIVAKENIDGVNFCTSKPIFLEFFNKHVSKAVALKKIGDLLRIRKEETIAIGDGFNDLSMLEYAGLSVSMGNAPQIIKEKCHYVTQSNDNDGVATFLEKLGCYDGKQFTG